jgi:hypothetical protein
VAPKIAPAQLSLYFPTSEQYSLIVRWTVMMSKDFEDAAIAAIAATDDFWYFKNWAIEIPRYIGASMALDDAAKCYLNCKLAFANPTDMNLLAVQSSKFKAVSSVRLALEMKASRPVEDNILIAVHLLYIIEVCHGNRSIR